MEKKKARKEIAKAIESALKKIGIGKTGKKGAKIIGRAAAKLAETLEFGIAKKPKKAEEPKKKQAVKKKSAVRRKPATKPGVGLIAASE